MLPKGVTLIPVGGITAANIPAYRAAGSTAFAIGSTLYSPGKTASAVRASADALVPSPVVWPRRDAPVARKSAVDQPPTFPTRSSFATAWTVANELANLLTTGPLAGDQPTLAIGGV